MLSLPTSVWFAAPGVQIWTDNATDRDWQNTGSHARVASAALTPFDRGRNPVKRSVWRRGFSFPLLLAANHKRQYHQQRPQLS
jgi:hypothetical protein